MRQVKPKLVAHLFRINGVVAASEQDEEVVRQAIIDDALQLTLTVSSSEDDGGESTTREVIVAPNGDFSVWLEADRVATLVPSHSSLRFSPKSMVLRGEASDGVCADGVRLTAWQGEHRVGSVDPPLQGVVVKAFALLDDELVASATSGADGAFSLGPLEPGVEYRFEARKPAYELTAPHTDRPLDYVAKPLGALSVVVRDDDGRGVDEVLLSLAGDSYQTNVASDASGEAMFDGLPPGQYFLRASLKEYEFEPASMQLDVVGGRVLPIEFTARRVSFSVYGTVVTLAGDAGAELLVDATSIDDQYDRHQTSTNTDGSFRLRGLQPGGTYQVTVRNEAGSSQRVSMPVEGDDVRDVDLAVRGSLSTSSSTLREVSGMLVTPSGEPLPARVRVVRLYRNNKLFSSVTLHYSPSFRFKNVPKDGNLELSVDDKRYTLNDHDAHFSLVTIVDSSLMSLDGRAPLTTASGFGLLFSACLIYTMMYFDHAASLLSSAT